MFVGWFKYVFIMASCWAVNERVCRRWLSFFVSCLAFTNVCFRVLAWCRIHLGHTEKLRVNNCRLYKLPQTTIRPMDPKTQITNCNINTKHTNPHHENRRSPPSNAHRSRLTMPLGAGQVVNARQDQRLLGGYAHAWRSGEWRLKRGRKTWGRSSAGVLFGVGLARAICHHLPILVEAAANPLLHTNTNIHYKTRRCYRQSLWGTARHMRKHSMTHQSWSVWIHSTPTLIFGRWSTWQCLLLIPSWFLRWGLKK